MCPKLIALFKFYEKLMHLRLKFFFKTYCRHCAFSWVMKHCLHNGPKNHKASFVKADANKKHGPSKYVHLPPKHAYDSVCVFNTVQMTACCVGACVKDPKATDSKKSEESLGIQWQTCKPVVASTAISRLNEDDVFAVHPAGGYLHFQKISPLQPFPFHHFVLGWGGMRIFSYHHSNHSELGWFTVMWTHHTRVLPVITHKKQRVWNASKHPTEKVIYQNQATSAASRSIEPSHNCTAGWLTSNGIFLELDFSRWITFWSSEAWLLL